MSLLRRVLTGASATVVAAGLLTAGAAPASAITSAQCVHDSSTRFLTANDGEYKLWTQTIEDDANNARDLHICFGLGNVVRGDLVVRSRQTASISPELVPIPDDPDCPRLLELQDPIDLMTRLAHDLSGRPAYVCFGVADQTFRLTIGTLPQVTVLDVTLYLDKGTLVTDRFCAVYVGYVNCYTATDEALRFNIV